MTCPFTPARGDFSLQNQNTTPTLRIRATKLDDSLKSNTSGSNCALSGRERFEVEHSKVKTTANIELRSLSSTHISKAGTAKRDLHFRRRQIQEPQMYIVELAAHQGNPHVVPILCWQRPIALEPFRIGGLQQLSSTLTQPDVSTSFLPQLAQTVMGAVGLIT